MNSDWPEGAPQWEYARNVGEVQAYLQRLGLDKVSVVQLNGVYHVQGQIQMPAAPRAIHLEGDIFEDRPSATQITAAEVVESFENACSIVNKIKYSDNLASERWAKFEFGKALKIEDIDLSGMKIVTFNDAHLVHEGKTLVDAFRPSVITASAYSQPDVAVEAQRKRDGLCLKCGDRGEFIQGACVCRNGHGVMFG